MTVLALALAPLLGFPGFSVALLVAVATNPALQIFVAVIGAIGMMGAGGLSLFGELKKIRLAAAQIDAKSDLRFDRLEYKVDQAVTEASQAVAYASKVDRRIDGLYQWYIQRPKDTGGYKEVEEEAPPAPRPPPPPR